MTAPAGRPRPRGKTREGVRRGHLTPVIAGERCRGAPRIDFSPDLLGGPAAALRGSAVPAGRGGLPVSARTTAARADAGRAGRGTPAPAGGPRHLRPAPRASRPASRALPPLPRWSGRAPARTGTG